MFILVFKPDDKKLNIISSLDRKILCLNGSHYSAMFIKADGNQIDERDDFLHEVFFDKVYVDKDCEGRDRYILLNSTNHVCYYM